MRNFFHTLYSSSIGVEFWSNALMHSCYILNWTYHKAIKKTPYETWGGHKLDLKHMHAFGTLVTVKKPDNQPSKGYPLVYHVIFLQFTGTAKKIDYYDVNAGTIKVTTHKLHDKFQYSSDRNKRSYASRYIMDLIANDNDKKFYRNPILNGTIVNLIPTNIPHSTAATATTIAYDMEVDTLTPEEMEGFQSNSEQLYIYIK